jgi:hypothetical protein
MVLQASDFKVLCFQRRDAIHRRGCRTKRRQQRHVVHHRRAAHDLRIVVRARAQWRVDGLAESNSQQLTSAARRL